MTTRQEQDLRELLDSDSAEGIAERTGGHRGVTVADVDARARAIRRRRGRTAGSIAMAALAVVAVASLPRTEAAPMPEDVWTGVLAQPGAAPAPERSVPALPLYHRYERGGERETFRFRASATGVTFGMSCPADGHALIWLNGRFVASGPCGPTVAEPPGWLGDPAKAREGVNELTAALVPASSAGSGRMTEERAERLLAATPAYPAAWRLTVLDIRTLNCRADLIRIDPGSGEIIPSCSPRE
ncbi:hypothetical protein [Nonomuraea sp. KM90]|uniref:hypothetical protein n=1 Tax=Nonomuraea sp. KM90 TaxID=3457428 RepID=UPI003FCC7494